MQSGLTAVISVLFVVAMGCRNKPEPAPANHASEEGPNEPLPQTPAPERDPNRCLTLDEVAGEKVVARAQARKMTIPRISESIGRCEDAWEIALDGTVRPDCQAEMVAETCKDIFVEGRCSKAWDRVPAGHMPVQFTTEWRR